MSWVKSVFTPEEKCSNIPIMERAACKNQVLRDEKRTYKRSKRLIWNDLYAPCTKEALAVHPWKIQELESWLSRSLSGKMGAAPVALLVGPSGSGKTTALSLVAESMKCQVKEWINPVQYYTDGPSTSSNTCAGPTSQVDRFEDFLFRASRYQDLFQSEDTKSLLLVEDIPNVFLRDPALLENTLKKFQTVGRTPLIFVCESGANDSVERLLFKPQLQIDLRVTTISFNPVNKTIMCKALEKVLRMAKRDNHKLRMKEVNMEDIAAVANGDIRFAVNHLQFLMMGGEKGPSCVMPSGDILPARKGKSVVKNTLSSKDRSAEIFRCLGGVLYNRQETVLDGKTNTYIQRPAHNPSEISSKMSSVPNLFHGLLTENYPAIIKDVVNLSEASDLLSLTDVMMARHSDCGEREMHKMYAVDVSVHGLMNLPPGHEQRKFFPFKGSRVKEVGISVTKRLKKCRDLFPATCLQPLTMMNEVCPFLVDMDVGALTCDQKRFIQQLSKITSVRKYEKHQDVTEATEEHRPPKEESCIEVPDEPETESMSCRKSNEKWQCSRSVAEAQLEKNRLNSDIPLIDVPDEPEIEVVMLSETSGDERIDFVEISSDDSVSDL